MFNFDNNFKEEDHPRGQPGNAGQFGSGSGGGAEKDEVLSKIKSVNQSRVEAGNSFREETDPKKKKVLEKTIRELDRQESALRKQLGPMTTTVSVKPKAALQLPKTDFVNKIKGDMAPGEANNQLKNDPNLEFISSNGKNWTKEEMSFVPMEDGECHWNTAKLFVQGKIDAVVIGYAKNSWGWHQHTWGLKDGKVIETTASNKENSDWFGAPLDEANSRSFSDFVLKPENSPGNGNVRTVKGGWKPKAGSDAARMVGADMSEEDWDGLESGLAKWIGEERAEAEHAEDAKGDEEPNDRPIVTLPKGTDGLFIEPEELTPDVERALDHNRERFSKHFNYADEFGAGEQNSYDQQGRYNCGRCNQAQANKCLLVDIAKIDRVAGSCEDWEKIRAGDPEMLLKRKSPDVANYGVAKNGVGFGCSRCPYSKPAKNVDSEGRNNWCGEGGFHNTLTGCCTANGAETLKLNDKGAAQGQDEALGLNLEVNRDYDGPWISCMSKDGKRMYVNRSVPETVEIKGVEVDVDEDLLHHEVPELEAIQTLLAEFEEEHGRKPKTDEKKQIYLKAHHSAGTPSERQWCKERGIDWDALQAWFRGEESRIAKLKPKKLPPDPDVRPIPHTHGDLEIALDAEFKEEDHPRREDGKFGKGGGGSKKSKTEAKGKGEEAPKASTKGELSDKYSKDAKVVDGVIQTSNVDDAVLALYENRKVELDQPRQVTVLLDKLASEAKKMVDAGEDAPVFNLCNVTVKKTNLFCADSHGIPRVKMPQLDEGPGGADGFRDYLKEQGYEVEDTWEKAEYLRATQNELNGAQVASLAKIFEAGKRLPYTVFVSRDNYIIDGHHRWAAEIGVGYESGKDVDIHIERVDGGIIELLAQAKKYTGGKGMVGINQTQKIKGADEFKEEDHPRDEDGKFGKGSGGAKGPKAKSEHVEEASEFETFFGKPIEGLEREVSELERLFVKGEQGVRQHAAHEIQVRAEHLALHKYLKGKLSDEEIEEVFEHVQEAEKAAKEKAKHGEDKRSLKEKFKDLMNSPNVAKSVATAVGHFVGEHTVGLAHHAVRKEVVLPLIGSLVTETLPSLGIQGHEGKTIALAVAAYAVSELMSKTGLTAHNARKLLVTSIEVLRKQVSASTQMFPLEKVAKAGGDAAPKEDEVSRALRRFMEGLQEIDPDELQKAQPIKGKQKPAKDEALWLALDHYLRASGGGEKYALDRSVREYDADGRLHVTVANISKANICPYMGKEIPDEDGTLKLEPEKVYQLLRDPEELAKAAHTFNGIPVLREHIPVSADDHQPDEVIGATGTDAEFIDPYLRNSLVIWSKDDIDLIKSGEKRELSAGYRYVPIMEPGVYKGVKFDGRMTQICGNHVVTCVEGRAGTDIRIGDKVPEALRWAAIEQAILAEV